MLSPAFRKTPVLQLGCREQLACSQSADLTSCVLTPTPAHQWTPFLFASVYSFFTVTSKRGIICHHIQTLILTLVCRVLICSYSTISTLSLWFLINVLVIVAFSSQNSVQVSYNWVRKEELYINKANVFKSCGRQYPCNLVSLNFSFV